MATFAAALTLGFGCGDDGSPRDISPTAPSTTVDMDKYPDARQAEIRESLERELAAALPDSFGCLLYPEEFSPLIARVRPSAVDRARQIVADQGHTSLVRVTASPNVPLYRVHRKIFDELRQGAPDDNLVSVEAGSPVATSCPRVRIVVDKRAADNTRSWAFKARSDHPRDVTVQVEATALG